MEYESDTLAAHDHEYRDYHYWTNNDNSAYQNYGADKIYLDYTTRRTQENGSSETRPKNRKVVYIMKINECVAQK